MLKIITDVKEKNLLDKTGEGKHIESISIKNANGIPTGELKWVYEIPDSVEEVVEPAVVEPKPEVTKPEPFAHKFGKKRGKK